MLPQPVSDTTALLLMKIKRELDFIRHQQLDMLEEIERLKKYNDRAIHTVDERFYDIWHRLYPVFYKVFPHMGRFEDELEMFFKSTPQIRKK